MKNIVIMTISFALVISTCLGQQQIIEIKQEWQLDTLDQLLTYFVKKGSAIPSHFCKDYLNVEYYDQAYSGCYSEEVKQLNGLYFLVVKLSCMAGGTCESKMLFVIKDRKVKSQLQISDEQSDMSFVSIATHKFILDTLIEVESTKKEFEFDLESDDDEGKLILDTVYFEYHVINTDGSIVKLQNKKSPYREYPETSYRVLKSSELNAYTKDELDVMRNEIFASYGFIFKTEKWKTYFMSKQWYTPELENVDPLLSCIERVNIERILKANK